MKVKKHPFHLVSINLSSSVKNSPEVQALWPCELEGINGLANEASAHTEGCPIQTLLSHSRKMALIHHIIGYASLTTMRALGWNFSRVLSAGGVSLSALVYYNNEKTLHVLHTYFVLYLSELARPDEDWRGSWRPWSQHLATDVVHFSCYEVIPFTNQFDSHWGIWNGQKILCTIVFKNQLRIWFMVQKILGKTPCSVVVVVGISHYCSHINWEEFSRPSHCQKVEK